MGTIFSKFTSVGFRITAAAGFLILLSVVSGVLFLQNAGNYNDDAQTVTTLAKRTIQVFETDVLIYKMVRAEKDFVLTAKEQFKNERIGFSNAIDENFTLLISGAITDESKNFLNQLKERKIEYDQNFETAVGIYASTTATGGFSKTLDAYQAGVFEQVKALSLTNTDILIAAETNLINNIVNLDVGRIESTLEQAQANSDFATFVAYATILAALIMGFVVAFFVIRSTTKALRSIVERLIALADVLNESVNQATDAANKNATTATQLASSSTEQSKQVEGITTTISQTASAISGVATLAKEGSVSANKVSELSQKGGGDAEKAAERLQAISKIVSTAVQKIETLAASSREVGVLAGEVTNIADQTNILALNAAIEAARAGEAGRGFAVVADEVRRLAESSGKFADQITKLINSVVEQGQQTAQSTAEGAGEITESTNIINISLGSFKQISEAIVEANAKIQEISVNISQQAESAEQISTSAQSIARGIEQNTTGAKTLAGAVDQQKVMVSVVEKSLEEAKTLIKDSRALVGLKENDAMSDEVEETPTALLEEGEEENV